MTTKSRLKRGKREKFHVFPFRNPSGQTAWRLAGTKKDGTRVRANFKDKARAMAEKQTLELAELNLKPTPMLPTKLTEKQLADAEQAITELTKGTLVEAVRFFNENFQDPLKPVTYKDAVKRFLAEQKRRNVRPATYANLRGRLGALEDHTPADKLVSELLPEFLSNWLHRETGRNRGHQTIRNDRLALSNFFGWAKRNKHTVESPMDAVANIKVDRKKPEVLSVPAVRKLLLAAMAHNDGQCVPYFVLSLFCGLRPTEAKRLDWNAIDLTDRLVSIGTNETKVRGGSERYVTIPDNAVEWLTPHALKKTPLGIGRKDFAAIKAAAGLEKWPLDVLRHTAISNHLAEHQHEGTTAEQMGNSIEVIKRFYRRAVKPAAAKEFWSLTPGTVSAEIIDLSKPHHAVKESPVEAKAAAR